MNLETLGVRDSSIAEESAKLSKELYIETIKILEENKWYLEEIAEALIEKETLNGNQLDEILDRIRPIETTKAV